MIKELDLIAVPNKIENSASLEAEHRLRYLISDSAAVPNSLLDMTLHEYILSNNLITKYMILVEEKERKEDKIEDKKREVLMLSLDRKSEKEEERRRRDEDDGAEILKKYRDREDLDQEMIEFLAKALRTQKKGSDENKKHLEKKEQEALYKRTVLRDHIAKVIYSCLNNCKISEEELRTGTIYLWYLDELKGEVWMGSLGKYIEQNLIEVPIASAEKKQEVETSGRSFLEKKLEEIRSLRNLRLVIYECGKALIKKKKITNRMLKDIAMEDEDLLMLREKRYRSTKLRKKMGSATKAKILEMINLHNVKYLVDRESVYISISRSSASASLLGTAAGEELGYGDLLELMKVINKIPIL